MIDENVYFTEYSVCEYKFVYVNISPAPCLRNIVDEVTYKLYLQYTDIVVVVIILVVPSVELASWPTKYNLEVPVVLSSQTYVIKTLT